MSLTPGTRIGPYEILAPLGAGGMGEVYRARDARLDRDVAIKILPDIFAADPDRLARFEREARTLATLNHPNIAQVHGVETPASSGPALVMELAEGEDLSLRISRGAVPFGDTLAIARQIADALEAAHERGIIHRDLKPANIKVSADGAVKVLDFGLAKAIEGGDAGADARNSPTISLAGTREGLILGTAGYMAPEQARGQTVDRRADIWAFGVIVFEMLSGKQVFAGATISDVLASVLKNDIDWGQLPADLPAPMLSLLKRCLDPERRTRLRDIGEARIAIDQFIAQPQPSSGRTAPGRMTYAALTVTAALVIAVAGIAIRGRAAPVRSMRMVATPPHGVSVHVIGRPSIALAPDGWTLAFVGIENGNPYLFVRGPGDFDARKLADTEGAGGPVFSPDGRMLAYTTVGDLKVLTLDGTTAVLGRVNDPRGIAWVDDARLLYTPESIGGLMEIAVTGGAPRPVTTLNEQAGERTHRWPHVLPGGEWVLFTVGTTASPDRYDEANIDAVNRVTGERRNVFKGASMARYAASGHLVFSRSGTLFAVRFDPERLEATGTPVSILQGISGDWTTGAAHIAWSPDGTFAYVPGDARGGMRQLVWSDLSGTRRSIPLPPALYNDMRLSPDASRLALADGTSGLADIWAYTFARGTHTRLTFTGACATPVWSADGRSVYFASIDRAGAGSKIFRTSADGGREPELLVAAAVRVYLKHVSADGKWALVDYFAFGGARANVGRIALQPGAKVEPLVDSRADEYAAALSPDGRYVAYQSDEGGRPEIFVRELGANSGRWQVSNAGGEEPMWSADGRTIFFRFESRLFRASIERAGAFQFGLPAPLFEGVYNLRSDTGVSYQPHPDGTRLLMARAADVVSGGNIRVITGWFETLKEIK